LEEIRNIKPGLGRVFCLKKMPEIFGKSRHAGDRLTPPALFTLFAALAPIKLLSDKI
jgi:hypothetical protein